MKQILSLLALVCALTCFTGTEVSAQYTAVGVRLGSPVSASFKFFPGGGDNAIEAFVGYRSDKISYSFGNYGWTSISLGGLYQVHKPLDLGDISGLQYYYGGSASAFFWSYDDGYPDSNDYGSVSFGILGNAGLDYTFENLPINLSVDWMPRVFLGSGFNTGFGYGYGALSVRYILGRN